MLIVEIPLIMVYLGFCLTCVHKGNLFNILILHVVSLSFIYFLLIPNSTLLVQPLFYYLINVNFLSVFLYLFAGFIWSLVKYKLVIRKIRIEINKIISERPSPNYYQGQLGKLKDSMRIENNKENIAIWILFFPYSIIWTLISEWALDLTNWFIEEVFKKVFQIVLKSEMDKIENTKP